MKSFITIIALTIGFLSAGAFAHNDVAQQIKKENITVVFKNQAWPLKGQITVEPCKINRCRDA